MLNEYEILNVRTPCTISIGGLTEEEKRILQGNGKLLKLQALKTMALGRDEVAQSARMSGP